MCFTKVRLLVFCYSLLRREFSHYMLCTYTLKLVSHFSIMQGENLFFSVKVMMMHCPGFGQDRVNFHRTPGRCRAGRADPTWPNRAGYSIPCDVMLGSGGGELGTGTHSWLGSMGTGPGELLSGSCGLCCAFLLICIVVVTVPFVCCSVKLPLSRPTSFYLFLSILLCTPAGGGATAWRFCCWLQPNENMHFKENCWNFLFSNSYFSQQQLYE